MSNRTAPLDFWVMAQTFLNTLFCLFGPPESVAFQHTHTGAQRALLLPWLQAGEVLMRRLLLLEASAYPKPNTRPLLARIRAKRAKRLVGFDHDKPETWRVSLRCFASLNSSPARGGSGSRQSRETKGGVKRLSRFDPNWRAPKPAKFYSAWPLAERYEALIRVFNNPAPFAKRLAARLHATSHRGVEIMRLPKLRRARQSGDPPTKLDMIGADFTPLDGACTRSLLALNSS